MNSSDPTAQPEQVEPTQPEFDNKYVKVPNTEPFQMLLINPNTITDRDWKQPDYLHNLLVDKFSEFFSMDPSDYIETIGRRLEIGSYKYPDVKVVLVGEEVDYIYELMYVDVLPEYKTPERENGFATLLDIEGNIIYGNALVVRTFISSQNVTDTYHVDATVDNVELMLNRRAATSAIIYSAEDEEYKEIPLFGPLDKFSEVFFDKQHNIKKIELPFLSHNLNIWYTEDEYGMLDVCGNLLPDKVRIEQMLVFTMWTNEYRGNLTLDEFVKILYLSKVLKDYTSPNELINNQERDSLDRVIVYNKYRILNNVYNKYKK